MTNQPQESQPSNSGGTWGSDRDANTNLIDHVLDPVGTVCDPIASGLREILVVPILIRFLG